MKVISCLKYIEMSGDISMEQELTRIGVSLPENLLEKFDEIITKGATHPAQKEYGMRYAAISATMHG